MILPCILTSLILSNGEHFLICRPRSMDCICRPILSGKLLCCTVQYQTGWCRTSTGQYDQFHTMVRSVRISTSPIYGLIRLPILISSCFFLKSMHIIQWQLATWFIEIYFKRSGFQLKRIYTFLILNGL